MRITVNADVPDGSSVNGKPLAPGKTYDLADDEGRLLVRLGHATVVADASPPTARKKSATKRTPKSSRGD